MVKKVLLLAAMSGLLLVYADGGPSTILSDNEQNLVKKRSMTSTLKEVTTMVLVSIGFGVASELSNRAIDARAAARAVRCVALDSDIQFLLGNLIITGRAFPGSQRVTEGSVSTVFNFDSEVVMRAVRGADALIEKKRFEYAANVPSTVFTVPVKKNASDLLFLTGNYAAVSLVKYSFMIDEERKKWALDNPGSLYPLPHLNFWEVALIIVAQGVGRHALKPGFMHLPFGFSHGGGRFSSGY